MRYPYILSVLLSIFFINNLSSQAIEDAIYDPDVASVTLHLASSPLSLPIVNLNAPNGVLQLGFDQLINDVSDFSYTIIHCDQDWEPSDLRPNEYLKAFQDDRITSYQTGFNTLTNYFHYNLRLPNKQIRWTKSGNYILKVWYEYETEKVVLTRRFMVVEPAWRIEAKLVPSARVSKRDTHHEFDFNVTTTNTRVPNPRNDVKAYVLQNGNWNTAIGPISPFSTRDDVMIYDYQDSISFPAGKEFRFFDIRTLDVKGYRVAEIERSVEGWDVFVDLDESTAYKPYSFWADIDGSFIIEYGEQPIAINLASNEAAVEVSPERTRQANMNRCDYALTFFTLRTKRPFENADLYIYGRLTDWQVQDQYMLQWDQATRSYLGEAFLKQGFYNYKYVLVDRDTGEIDPVGVEGNWYETNNKYTILTYFKPFGARYDQLMGGTSISSDVFRN